MDPHKSNQEQHKGGCTHVSTCFSLVYLGTFGWIRGCVGGWDCVACLTTEVGTRSVSNVGQRACVCGKGCRGGSRLRSRLFRGRVGGSCLEVCLQGSEGKKTEIKGGEIWRMDGRNHQPRSNPHNGWGESTNTVQRHGHPGRMLFIVRFFLSPLSLSDPFC
ncbi:hypothetical protein Naga_100009g64 [Nannochloropsis gaditana]|uniref:Uncharacterized protein n=1 Tax=Nannochloropsis gaditana TaxID=72520 RepID=W7U6S4_9STRA|nr:hypothetical protein Naga_100009g64 [Nannochloropsis gaditana]